ncbi:hypothetical protein WJX73_005226 [Symbiochloris irregularis]|uniref:Methyltransferase n=1 Tax=Symbiochloris irregularis TaxID=706552 RepID=A0AAW1PS07_9CHLO
MARDYLDSALEWLNDYTGDNKNLLAIGGAGAVLLLGSIYILPNGKDRHRLTGGGIKADRVKQEFNDYADAYGKEAGAGITDRTKTGQLVDTFYNLVTDIYEWGWGLSFHFSPRLPGKSWAASEAAHESRLAAILQLLPGKKCLDVGCGVGGPMRTIASTSGAEVTGITINQYQVQRAEHHNKKMGVQELCKPVQGDFLKMPFKDNSFDAAYAIEATCHAAKLEEVYGEIQRVLKPGGLFASYEWVATKHYDENNPEHVKIIDEINFGNGLPEMRTYKQAEEAGKIAGLELVMSIDIATASSVAGPWYNRLGWLMKSHIITFNSTMVWILARLHLAPAGMEDVHTMLVRVAKSLCDGGSTGVFSPMHLLVFKKPASPGKDQVANHVSA